MRVIAGECRGRALRCGRGPQFRPTAQKVKESIFDMIGGEVEGASVLDLFAGSGAMGIEALSRGAATAVFVEQEKKILRALRTNLERCGYGRGRADVVAADARRWLANLAARGGRGFDIVFADPPYASSLAREVVETLDAAPPALCRTLVVESGSPVGSAKWKNLVLRRERKYGGTIVTIYDRRNDATARSEGGDER